MLFISNYIYPFLMNFTATAIIYAGILFMSGKFMPELLSTVYANTNLVIRTVIAVAICTTPANVLISLVYKQNPASIASITNIIAVVLVLTIVSIMVDNIKINSTIIFALLIAVASCSFLLYNLTK